MATRNSNAKADFRKAGPATGHLVGYDWGASLAWQIADQHPERSGWLTVLSRPHPLAFARALEMPDGEQRRRSRHYTTFQEADCLLVVWHRQSATARP